MLNNKAVLEAYNLLMEGMEFAKQHHENNDGEYYHDVVNFVHESFSERISNIMWYAEPTYAKDLLALFGEMLAIILDGKARENTYKSIVDAMKSRIEYLAGGEVMVWVNVYNTTRHYGGPEEGGWYYNWTELVEAHYVPYDKAEEKVAELKGEHGEGEGNIYSVRGGYAVDVRIEGLKGESRSTERPYYC